MKTLQTLQLIAPKKGPSGDFRYVLLQNPNAAVEWMYSHKLVQPGPYARFLDRLAEVGGSGELDAIRAYWAAAAAATPAVAATVTPPVTTR